MSFAAGLSDVVTPQIHAWVQQSDIHTRLVRFDQAFLESLEQNSSSPAVEYPRSATVRSGASSMALAIVHQSNASLPPPSLRSWCPSASTEATPTETSISTGLANHFSGVRLLEDHNGVLTIPQAQIRAPVYECAFWFLSCGFLTADKDEWETHCLSHFRGEEPPQTVQCPLCDWVTTQDDGMAAWSYRMHHMAYSHTMYGETLRTSRPDFEMFHYLWQRRLIDDQDLKELKGGNHNLTTPPGNFVETNGRRGRRGQEGRRHRSQHVSSVRQVGPRRV